MDGIPYAVTPSPTVTHQAVSSNIAAIIKDQFKSKTNFCLQCSILMQTDWQVPSDTVVRPDVMVICQPVDEIMQVTPELIVEVVSSSSTKRDEVMKFDLYQREDVNYYVLVYPEKHLAKVYLNNQQGV